MKFKVKHYSNERLQRELEEAHSRLRGYLDARDHMPLSSILGSLAIASGIKYENALIAALFEELESRGVQAGAQPLNGKKFELWVQKFRVVL